MWKSVLSFCLLTTLAGFDVEAVGDSKQSIVKIWKNQESVLCLGVVVDKKYIATSAHCVYGSAASSLSVKTVAKQNSTEFDLEAYTETVSEVQKVLVHPFYMPPSPDYNIALLKLKSPLTDAQALIPGNVEPLPSDVVQKISWDPRDSESPLETAEVKIEDRKSCKIKIGNFVTGRMICAYDKNSSFKRDGPLIFKDKLAGIPSKRIENNQGALPAIYTNIANSEILSFIETYV